MRLHFKLLVLFFISFCSFELHAAELDADEPGELYQVEVIAFTHDASLSGGEEEHAQHYADELDTAKASLLKANAQSNDLYALLPKWRLRLRKEAHTLLNKPQFHVLFHYAWLQKEGKAKSLHLYNQWPQQLNDLYGLSYYDKSGAYPIDGTLRISKGLYYYLNSNFLIRPEAESPEKVYLLKQKRRLKANEIHYIDHPKLGMLVMIHPIKTS